MACIVHYANHLCHLKGSGCMADEVYAPLVKEVEGVLALGIAAEQLLEELEKHIQEAEPFFSLIEAN
jgi:hypothetical protein